MSIPSEIRQVIREELAETVTPRLDGLTEQVKQQNGRVGRVETTVSQHAEMLVNLHSTSDPASVRRAVREALREIVQETLSWQNILKVTAALSLFLTVLNQAVERV